MREPAAAAPQPGTTATTAEAFEAWLATQPGPPSKGGILANVLRKAWDASHENCIRLAREHGATYVAGGLNWQHTRRVPFADLLGGDGDTP